MLAVEPGQEISPAGDAAAIPVSNCPAEPALALLYRADPVSNTSITRSPGVTQIADHGQTAVWLSAPDLMCRSAPAAEASAFDSISRSPGSAFPPEMVVGSK